MIIKHLLVIVFFCVVFVLTIIVTDRKILSSSHTSISDIISIRKNKKSRERRLSTQNKTPQSNDDPCSQPRPPRGEHAPLGVLYVVAGNHEFVTEAFLPVIRFLRFKLGIPDASFRDPDEPKWALATEPHLCRGVLQPVLSFFDVIITDLVVPIDTPSYDDDDEGDLGDVIRKHHNGKLPQRTFRERFGAWKLGWNKYDGDQKHFIKGLKISALEIAPFAKTIYLDVDSIPCDPHFPYRLVEALGSANLALTPVDAEGYLHAETEHEHWELPPGNFNRHNSGCVVLNMEMKKTRQLLRLWKYLFFQQKKRGYEYGLDQPWLGRAMKFMYERRGLKHVDLDLHFFAQRQAFTTKERPTCESGKWLVIHKTGLIRAKDWMD